MVVAVEPQQQRIAPELEEGTSVGICVGKERGEARVDGVGEVLGALPAPSSQALGEPGKSRHIDEHHGARERLYEIFRCGDKPFEEHTRDIAVALPRV
jgi:hypothetical protein